MERGKIALKNDLGNGCFLAKITYENIASRKKIAKLKAGFKM
jgi:hypothetical protein